LPRNEAPKAAARWRAIGFEGEGDGTYPADYGVRGACKLPQRDPRQSHDRKRVLVHFELKRTRVIKIVFLTLFMTHKVVLV